jgi:hypothetical protein
VRVHRRDQDRDHRPGDPNHERAGSPTRRLTALGADLSPAADRWDAKLGEYVLDWDDIRERPDPRAAAAEFLRAAFQAGA